MTAEDDEARDEESTETRTEDRDDRDERDDERVKADDKYDADTPGVTDARPGRDDIGESMPSDYHQAVADRPVEVKLPETPDLSEDSSDRSEGS